MPSWIKWFLFFAGCLVLAVAITSKVSRELKGSRSIKAPAPKRATSRQLGDEARTQQPPNEPYLVATLAYSSIHKEDAGKSLDVPRVTPEDLREVKAEEPATILSVSAPDYENFQAIVLTDSRGQHTLRLKKVGVKPGQQLTEGQLIGYRHAVIYLVVGAHGPDGKPIDLSRDLQPMVPAPENTYHKKSQ